MDQNNPPKKPRNKVRLTIGGLLALVALSALWLNYVRSRSTRWVDLKVGTGPAVRTGDSVTVNYVLTLESGAPVDRSQAPFSVAIGKGQLIQGFDKGLLGMQAGGRRKLIIPPNEGYGPTGAPPVVPPNATLVFDIQLLQVSPSAASVSPATAPAPAAPNAPTDP
jgi:hypothetical protein